MNGIFDCARWPISVGSIPSVCLRHLLIWEEVAVQKTLSKSTYLKQPSISRCGVNRVTDAYEAALNVGESTGGARKACGNCLVLK
jgi:hypothetical protein